MQISFVNQTKVKMPKRYISTWVENCVKELEKKKIKITKEELVIVFVSSKTIQSLNKTYRKKNKPTDILSFEGIEPSSLGELVICPHIIKQQSKEHKLTFNQELGYMILHGILHLLGYDHEKSPKQAQIMFNIQDTIFHRLLS